MSIINYVDLFVGALINMMLYFHIVKIVFKKEIKADKKTVIIILILSSIFISLINIFNKDTFKVVLTFPFIVIAVKKSFSINYKDAMIYIVFSLFYILISEVIVGVVLNLLPFDYTFIFNHILGTTTGAVLVAIFAFPFIHIDKISKVVRSIYVFIREKIDIFLILIVVLILGALAYKNISNVTSLVKLIMNAIVVLSFISIMYLYYLESKKSNELSENYNDLLDYLEKYEKELNEKRKVIHDHKNQLIIINGYIDDSAKLKEYMKELIDEQKNIVENSIIKNIDKLPKGLKGLIYYKMSHIEKTTVTLQVLSNLKRLEKLPSKINRKILKVIGILIDNAIEATETEKSKYINISFSIKKKVFKMEMTNPCTKNIEKEKLTNIGFSTKGKNRGYGLTLVNEIIEEEKDINVDFNIENSEFISILKINI